MPVVDAVIVAVIVAAFAVFAGVLAWAEYQTRKDGKSGDNGCNDYCVYDRHDILFRDGSNSMKMTGFLDPIVEGGARLFDNGPKDKEKD